MSLQMYLTRRHKYCNVAEIWYLNTSHWTRKLPGFIQPWHFQFQTNPVAGEKITPSVPTATSVATKFYPGVEIFQPSEEQNLNDIFQLVTEIYSGQFCGRGKMFLEIGWMEIPESSCHAASIVGRGEMAWNTAALELKILKYRNDETRNTFGSSNNFRGKSGFMFLKRFLASLKLNTSRCFPLPPSHLQSPPLWEVWRQDEGWKPSLTYVVIGNAFPRIGYGLSELGGFQKFWNDVSQKNIKLYTLIVMLGWLVKCISALLVMFFHRFTWSKVPE